MAYVPDKLWRWEIKIYDDVLHSTLQPLKIHIEKYWISKGIRTLEFELLLVRAAELI